MTHAVLDACRAELAALAPGTVVAINAETAEFTVGKTEDAALDAFEERFGWGVPACVHVVGASRAEPRKLQ